MKIRLLIANDLKKYFLERGYNCVKTYQIVNNNDTVFITAGIQPILSDYRNSKLNDNASKKIYLSQPVIRTQFVNSISEGSSVAFINSTSAGFNISEKEHNDLVKDWLELFYKLGMHPLNISSRSKEYERTWGDLEVLGRKTFYYYNNIELGDTTFFTSITKNGKKIGIDTMSDVGFGLERIRWCVNHGSYYDLYSDSSSLSPMVKAYLSVLSLLAVNNVKPSNKNSGYRIRQFSKKLANVLDGNEFSNLEKQYLMESIRYWKDWQEMDKDIDVEVIINEYTRNCNRLIINKLIEYGYNNLSGININVSREELKKRLLSAGVEAEKVKKIIRGGVL